eukprot:4135115-Prymnesium_polylepis.1
MRNNVLVDVEIVSVSGTKATARPLGSEAGREAFEVALDCTPHVSDTFVDSTEEYYQFRKAYCDRLSERLGTMEDALTGTKLKTAEHLINISIRTGVAADSAAGQVISGGLRYADYANVKDVGQLA